MYSYFSWKPINYERAGGGFNMFEPSSTAHFGSIFNSLGEFLVESGRINPANVRSGAHYH